MSVKVTAVRVPGDGITDDRWVVVERVWIEEADR